MSVERSDGMRNFDISERHRMWHQELHMCDLDYVVVENLMRRGKVSLAAIVEYKHDDGKLSDFQRLTLEALGEATQLPVMLVKYDYQITRFTITPINDVAADRVQKLTGLLDRGIAKGGPISKLLEYLNRSDGVVVNELCYVLFLHMLRGTLHKLKGTFKFNRKYREGNDSGRRTVDSRPVVCDTVSNSEITQELKARSVELVDEIIDDDIIDYG